MRWLLRIIVFLFIIACITAAVFWWRSYGHVDTLSVNLRASRYSWSSRSPVPGYFFFERFTGTTAEAIAQTEEIREGVISFKTRKRGSFKSAESYLMGMGDNEKNYWAGVQRYDGPWKIEAPRADSRSRPTSRFVRYQEENLSAKQRYVGWFAPARLVVGVLALWPLLWGLVWARRTGTRRGRRKENRCLGCGYDLRESPGRCPECGREARV